jgi:hypothetical protein
VLKFAEGVGRVVFTKDLKGPTFGTFFSGETITSWTNPIFLRSISFDFLVWRTGGLADPCHKCNQLSADQAESNASLLAHLPHNAAQCDIAGEKWRSCKVVLPMPCFRLALASEMMLHWPRRESLDTLDIDMGTPSISDLGGGFTGAYTRHDCECLVI